MKIIAFLTDFGLKDGYVAQMKAVASTLTDARFIDITHDIAPQNIPEGAYILQTVTPYFPPGTIIVAVVDPGVGTKRKGLVITTKNHVLIGPDNGLLMPAAHTLGDFTVYEITNERLMNKPVSSTFHGRDIFAPVAAHITNGVPFVEIGPRTTDYVDYTIEPACIKEGCLSGKVVHIDRFGNVITNITSQQMAQYFEDQRMIRISIAGADKKMLFAPTYGCVSKGSPLATIGSTGFLELTVDHGNAAQELNLKQDDTFQIYLD
jgi:S-adenosyl-L-methionine hydrolase (adenosine-forming)